MNGYGYKEKQPTEKCPYCDTRCDADFVDIGVGYQQCGPYFCQQCGASEIGPDDEDRAPPPGVERKGNWYAPAEDPSDKANVIGGKVVSHRVMDDTYREKFIDNPMYEVPGAVEAWRNDLRAGRG